MQASRALSLLEGIGDIIGKGGKLALKLSATLGIDAAGGLKKAGGVGKKIIEIAQKIQMWLDAADDEQGAIDKVLDKVEDIAQNWPSEGLVEGDEKASRAVRFINKKMPWLAKLIKSATAGSPIMNGIRQGLEGFIAAIGKLVGKDSTKQNPVDRATKFLTQSPEKKIPVGAAVFACKTLGGCKDLKEEKRTKEMEIYNALVKKYTKVDQHETK